MLIASFILWLVGDLWLLIEAFRTHWGFGVGLLAPSLVVSLQAAGIDIVPLSIAIIAALIAFVTFAVYHFNKAVIPIGLIIVGMGFFYKDGGTIQKLRAALGIDQGARDKIERKVLKNKKDSDDDDLDDGESAWRPLPRRRPTAHFARRTGGGRSGAPMGCS